MPAARRAGRADVFLLGSLVLASWCLAATHAFVRPLFQVSDELNYLHTVQGIALQRSDLDRRCVAPPDGVLVAYPPGGGKFGFHDVGARTLLGLCHVGAGTAAIPLTRAVLALTLPVLVVCTWALARMVLPGEPQIAAAAAVFTAFQPVLATFAGGITPDGLANAAAAITLLIAAHMLLNRTTGFWLLPLMISAVGAVASKDSTLFLGPLVVIVACTWAMERGWRRRAAVIAALTLAGTAIVTSGLLPRLLTPFPNLGAVARHALTQPGPFLGTVGGAYASHVATLVRSGLGGLSNFGGGTLELSAGLLLLQCLLLGLGAVGVAARLTVSGGHRLRRFFAFSAVAVAIAALQIPVRQMMTDSLGPMQGRWLFPVWPLIAVGCAAGWDQLLGGRIRRALPLLTLSGAVVAATALVQVIAYYYASWPSTYEWPHVFLLAAEGQEAGSSVARAMAIAAEVPPSWRYASLSSAFMSLVLAQIASARLATRADAPDPSHDRHADHR